MRTRYVSDEECYLMETMLDVTIGEHGWRCEDGHWLTADEFRRWTKEQIINAFYQVFGEA